MHYLYILFTTDRYLQALLFLSGVQNVSQQMDVFSGQLT